MRFQYFAPATLEEAQAFLRRSGKGTRLIAGGTDLFLKLKEGAVAADRVMDITAIAELGAIRKDENGGLRIGAAVPIRALERSALVQKEYPILSQAAGQLGSAAIRNVATLGGNLCNASPSAEMSPPLIGLSAAAKVLTAVGETVVPLEDFFVGPGQTVLGPQEILLEILVPAAPAGSRGAYLKHSFRGSIDLAIVGVAAVLAFEEGICRDVRIVLGAVGPTPLRARKAEKLLKGKPLSEALIGRASAAAAEEAKPISDVRASAVYRREMVQVLAARAIREAMAGGAAHRGERG